MTELSGAGALAALVAVGGAFGSFGASIIEYFIRSLALEDGGNGSSTAVSALETLTPVSSEVSDERAISVT